MTGTAGTFASVSDSSEEESSDEDEAAGFTGITAAFSLGASEMDRCQDSVAKRGGKEGVLIGEGEGRAVSSEDSEEEELSEEESIEMVSVTLESVYTSRVRMNALVNMIEPRGQVGEPCDIGAGGAGVFPTALVRLLDTPSITSVSSNVSISSHLNPSYTNESFATSNFALTSVTNSDPEHFLLASSTSVPTAGVTVFLFSSLMRAEADLDRFWEIRKACTKI